MANQRFEQIANGALVIAAIAIAGSVVYRVAFQSDAGSASVAIREQSDWSEALAVGRQVGNESAKVQLVEFVDLECPACRVFAPTLERIRAHYGDKIGVTYVHFPLRMHKHALAAARAAECAQREGRFDAMVSVILRGNDSLSLGLWREYAREAGVSDVVLFNTCMQDTMPVPAVERGLALAGLLGVNATPTIFAGAWRFSNTPTERELRRAIDALLEGEAPPLYTR